MIQREKRIVEVDVRFSTEGRLRPLQIIFDKGQVYIIDKIKHICRRAADVGGVGDRYTCMIQGKERELWFEDGRWFVAAKVVTKQTPPSNAKGAGHFIFVIPRCITRYSGIFVVKKGVIAMSNENKIRFLYVQPGKYPEERFVANELRPFSSLSLGSGLYFFRPRSAR